MIKASEGGGGKGIRKAKSDEEFATFFRQVGICYPNIPKFLFWIEFNRRIFDTFFLRSRQRLLVLQSLSWRWLKGKTIWQCVHRHVRYRHRHLRHKHKYSHWLKCMYIDKDMHRCGRRRHRCTGDHEDTDVTKDLKNIDEKLTIDNNQCMWRQRQTQLLIGTQRIQGQCKVSFLDQKSFQSDDNRVKTIIHCRKDFNYQE